MKHLTTGRISSLEPARCNVPKEGTEKLLVPIVTGAQAEMMEAMNLVALEARVACLVPSVILDAGHIHRAAQANANFGFGTIGHRAVAVSLYKGHVTKNRAKKERRKLKGKK